MLRNARCDTESLSKNKIEPTRGAIQLFDNNNQITVSLAQNIIKTMSQGSSPTDREVKILNCLQKELFDVD